MSPWTWHGRPGNCRSSRAELADRARRARLAAVPEAEARAGLRRGLVSALLLILPAVIYGLILVAPFIK